MHTTSVTLAVAGAGLRGTTYARRALSTRAAKVVAVAERDPVRRAAFATEHGLPPERVFADWRELAAAGRVADGVIIATQDAEHVEPAVRFAGLGYHILLEKPMATSEADCARIVEAVERAGSMLAVCHVLRYTPCTREIRKLIAAGRIGDPLSVQHLEPVGWGTTPIRSSLPYGRRRWSGAPPAAPWRATRRCPAPPSSRPTWSSSCPGPGWSRARTS
jgi:predicted dehydrogenase